MFEDSDIVCSRGLKGAEEKNVNSRKSYAFSNIGILRIHASNNGFGFRYNNTSALVEEFSVQDRVFDALTPSAFPSVSTITLRVGQFNPTTYVPQGMLEERKILNSNLPLPDLDSIIAAHYRLFPSAPMMTWTSMVNSLSLWNLVDPSVRYFFVTEDAVDRRGVEFSRFIMPCAPWKNVEDGPMC